MYLISHGLLWVIVLHFVSIFQSVCAKKIIGLCNNDDYPLFKIIQSSNVSDIDYYIPCMTSSWWTELDMSLIMIKVLSPGIYTLEKALGGA